MSTQPIHRWPRVRARKNGTHIVRGWYTVQWRFMTLRRFTHACMRFLSVFLLLFSAMPLMGTIFNFVPEGTYWFLLANKLAEFRQWPLIELHGQFPKLTEELWLHPSAPFNWVYFLMGLMMYKFAWQLSGPVGRFVALALPPLVKRRVTVKIDQNRIRFLHLGFPRRFKRMPGVPVQFMCDQIQNPVSSNLGSESPCQTVMRYGHRKIMICGSMHMRDAERLALGLSYARDLCDGTHHGFNTPEMPMPAMPMGW